EPTPVPRRDPAREFLAKLTAPTIVFCTTTGCPPCEQAKRQTLPWLERSKWTVVTVDDPQLCEALDVSAYPTFLGVRRGEIVGRCQSIRQPDLCELLKALRGASFDHLGDALVDHVLRARPAGSAGAEELAVGSAANPAGGPVVSFPTGPSFFPLDFLRDRAGSEHRFGIALLKIPAGLSWTASRTATGAVRLDLQPQPTIGFARFLRELVRIEALEVSLDEVRIRLAGCGSFRLRIHW
ncbi:MAG: thioredoxin family protein, partial [Phycisphaeraceae bacterium]|nr:thioredoxin family protein [Phycisphaeraceae bacterium]